MKRSLDGLAASIGHAAARVPVELLCTTVLLRAAWIALGVCVSVCVCVCVPGLTPVPCRSCRSTFDGIWCNLGQHPSFCRRAASPRARSCPRCYARACMHTSNSSASVRCHPSISTPPSLRRPRPPLPPPCIHRGQAVRVQQGPWQTLPRQAKAGNKWCVAATLRLLTSRGHCERRLKLARRGHVAMARKLGLLQATGTPAVAVAGTWRHPMRPHQHPGWLKRRHRALMQLASVERQVRTRRPPRLQQET